MNNTYIRIHYYTNSNGLKVTVSPDRLSGSWALLTDPYYNYQPMKLALAKYGAMFMGVRKGAGCK